MLGSMRNAAWCILLVGMAVLTLVGLRGCAKPVAMLHQRPSFDGKITVEGDSLSLSGELVFQRKSQHCQLMRRQPTTLALGRDREGNLFAYEADKYRPLQAEETRELRAVLALVDGTELSEPQRARRESSSSAALAARMPSGMTSPRSTSRERSRSFSIPSPKTFRRRREKGALPTHRNARRRA